MVANPHTAKSDHAVLRAFWTYMLHHTTGRGPFTIELPITGLDDACELQHAMHEAKRQGLACNLEIFVPGRWTFSLTALAVESLAR